MFFGSEMCVGVGREVCGCVQVCLLLLSRSVSMTYYFYCSLPCWSSLSKLFTKFLTTRSCALCYACDNYNTVRITTLDDTFITAVAGALVTRTLGLVVT